MPSELLLPHPLSIIPFAVLLLLIATGPVLFSHYWERHYSNYALALAAITAIYYVWGLNSPLTVWHAFIEYTSFILLLASLFVVSGGILIKFESDSNSGSNTVFLFLGALLSNIIGTTGASMLLLRPFIKLNRSRIRPFHIIFFIFIVSNVGGSLTPIGDPPLFLGFLRGVPFFWALQNVWVVWLTAISLILFVFWMIDRRSDSGVPAISIVRQFRSIRIKGAKNFILLGVIICAVFLDHSVLSFIPDLHPFPLGVRELVLLGTTIYAYKFSSREVFKANEFDLAPIREVAFLFIGIFITMIPALQLIAWESKQYGSQLTVAHFYWGSGLLSSVLDNAPTYLNFVSGAMGKFDLDINVVSNVQHFVVRDSGYLAAISIACVFFGAMTYIGNGPNFMVKSISERAGIKMPSFFTYIISYSIPVLLPVFIITWFIFFR